MMPLTTRDTPLPNRIVEILQPVVNAIPTLIAVTSVVIKKKDVLTFP